MQFDYETLNETEKIEFALRSLYRQYGYKQYRMGKFEEYDLYSRNKDFLLSDQVITFTDTNGKLMALKPDVTLSLIKNTKDNPDSVEKLFYNENVYRVSKGSDSFKEIRQTGLECFGNVSVEGLKEVLFLAMESLKTVSDSFVLEVSDLDILSAFIDEVTTDEAVKKSLWKKAGEKNLHGIAEVLNEAGIPEEKADSLKALLGISGTPEGALPVLKKLTEGRAAAEKTAILEKALSVFQCEKDVRITVDFSLIGDIHYYNGIIFKGFIAGIPESVLSGGEYKTLMQRMGKKSGAVGFAVYLDLMERLNVKK